MIIKIKKRLFLKPRRCPVCNRFRLFARHPSARCCKKCHELQRRISRRAERRRQKSVGVYKYNSHYKSVRKKELREHPYCALCGTETRLTVHHVGGGCEHYTVLCDDCHQAYERWNNIRKAKLWKKQIMRNRLTGGLSSWRNIMRRVQFHCRMFFYRIRIFLAFGHREARSAVLNSTRENITN